MTSTVRGEQAPVIRKRRDPVRILLVSQALGGVGVASGITAGSLAADAVSGVSALAGLAQTSTVLGASLLAVPLATLAAARGRRWSLASGYALAVTGSLIAVLGIVFGQFWLFLAGTLLFGGGTASNLQARFAAVDDATAENRGRRLSIVVWATSIGAIAGPNLLGPSSTAAGALGFPELTGPFFLSAASFMISTVVVMLFLPPRPAPVKGETNKPPRPRLSEVFRLTWAVPGARIGLLLTACAHAVMVGVMTMTPVHLGHGGVSLEFIGIVISLHVAGMYAASPLVGWGIDKYGTGRMATVGIAVLFLSLVLGILGGALGGGHEHAPVAGLGIGDVFTTVALTVLGLGWSFCTIVGSAMLTESLDKQSRIHAQGASDLLMGLAGAGAGAIGGPILALAGFSWLNAIAMLALIPVAVGVIRVARLRANSRRTEVAEGGNG